MLNAENAKKLAVAKAYLGLAVGNPLSLSLPISFSSSFYFLSFSKQNL